MPESRFRAALMGDPRYLGWNSAADILADIWDALVENSVVTVRVAGGKATPQKYERPKEGRTVKPTSIADFPIAEVLSLTS